MGNAPRGWLLLSPLTGMPSASPWTLSVPTTTSPSMRPETISVRSQLDSPVWTDRDASNAACNHVNGALRSPADNHVGRQAEDIQLFGDLDVHVGGHARPNTSFHRLGKVGNGDFDAQSSRSLFVLANGGVELRYQPGTG
jgi:hypothetical protein